MELQPHQQRVVDEKRELDEKREKLGAFKHTPVFEKLPWQEQERLASATGPVGAQVERVVVPPHPKRVQLSRAKGWRMPENTVKVTRPGPWGNLFVVWFGADAFGVDRWHVSHGSCHWQADSKEAATALAVERHEKWLRSWLADQIVAPHHVLHELRGKNLACWCAPGSPCHADTLLRYANPERHNAGNNRL